MKGKYKNLAIFLACVTTSSCTPENKVLIRKNSENTILEELIKAGISFKTSELEEIDEFLKGVAERFTQSDVNNLRSILSERNQQEGIDLYDVHVAVELIDLKSCHLTSMLFETGINFDLNDLPNIEKILKGVSEYFRGNTRHIYNYLKILNSNEDHSLLSADDVRSSLNTISTTFDLKYNQGLGV